MNLRWLVLKILDAMEFEDLFIHEAIERYTAELDLTKQERGFIKKLVFGTTEQRIYLDYIINSFSSVKVQKMKPAIRHTLRLSVYQLLFMENIPDSALCDEAVKLIKKRKMYKLTGFVNGVLRTIIRNKDHIELPDRTMDEGKYLSIKYAFDETVILHLMKQMSVESLERFLKVSNEEAPLTMRHHRHKGTKEELIQSLEADGLTLSKGKWLEEALIIEGVDRVTDLKAFKEGRCTVQDESSMLVSVIGVDPTVSRVLDVCSAPGGKALHAADLMGSKGLVKAYDLTQKKVDRINENKERLSVNTMEVAIGDATVKDSDLLEWADVVIADVPCTGLGIVRKKPDIKWHMSIESMNTLVPIQRDILSNIRDYVKPGGCLVYSTCTITEEENMGNVSWFLEENPDFSLEPIEGPYANDEGMVKLLPTSNGPDGFFIAKLRKR